MVRRRARGNNAEIKQLGGALALLDGGPGASSKDAPSSEALVNFVMKYPLDSESFEFLISQPEHVQHEVLRAFRPGKAAEIDGEYSAAMRSFVDGCRSGGSGGGDAKKRRLDQDTVSAKLSPKASAPVESCKRLPSKPKGCPQKPPMPSTSGGWGPKPPSQPPPRPSSSRDLTPKPKAGWQGARAPICPAEEHDIFGNKIEPQPRPPSGVPPNTCNLPEYMVAVGESDSGWEEEAAEIFREHGFVVVTGVLDSQQCHEVLGACRAAAKLMVGPSRKGNRGPSRYSFGNASRTGGMLHYEPYVRHLLDCPALQGLLELIFADGEHPGFRCIGGGGDFVLGNEPQDQSLHSDLYTKVVHHIKYPPPLLSVNFAVQDIGLKFGPMRMIPGTQQLRGQVPDPVPARWERSLLAPISKGTAILRDVRTLHSGTANFEKDTRFLPSVEYVSEEYVALGGKGKTLDHKCLPLSLFQSLSPEVQDLCSHIVVEDADLKPGFHRH